MKSRTLAWAVIATNATAVITTLWITGGWFGILAIALAAAFVSSMVWAILQLNQ